MNKQDLIDGIAADSGLTKVDSKKAVDSFMGVVTAELAKGGELTLTGFGSLSLREREARTGRNPQTGAPVEIASSKNVRFKAGSELRAAINVKVAKKAVAKATAKAGKK